MSRTRRSPLKEARERAGLTVTQLAEKSGVNRRTIVWAEHLAINSIPRWQAEQLAQALGKPLAKLFPPRKNAKPGEHNWGAEYDKILIDDNVGSDMIELTLRGAHQIALSISGYDSARLYAAVQDDEKDAFGFILFDSGRYQYAINPKHLVACRFFLRFDSDYPLPTEDDPDNHCKARLWLATSPEMVEFDVDEAVGTPGDPESCDENSLSNAMFDLDAGHQTARVRIIDGDEETTWVRVDDIAMFAADRCALYPEMRDAEQELRELANNDRIAEQVQAAKNGGPPKLVVSNDYRVGETEHDALTRLTGEAFAALASSVLLLLAGRGESQDMLNNMLAFARHLTKQGLLRLDHRGVIDGSPDIPVLDLNAKGDGHNDVLYAILRGSLKQVAAMMTGLNSEQFETARAELLDALIGFSGNSNAQRELLPPDKPG
jgi:transcriptional regulator with XRE-family HTH domain